jgi:hypothetical protein
MKHGFTANLWPEGWHDRSRLVKWIPFVGPGAAVFFLFVIYMVFDAILK